MKMTTLVNTGTVKGKKVNSFYNIVSKNMILVGLILLVIIMSVLSDRFLTFQNWMNIIVQSSISGIVAIGMTFVIITGGIDLSVGSILALSAALGAGMMKSGMPVLIAIVIMLICGVVVGGLQGVLIAKVKMPAFIVTLAGMTIARGITMVYTGGKTISAMPESFAAIGNENIGVIPIPVIIVIIAFLIAAYILQYTTYGRSTYALGGNREATKLSGISITRIEIGAYAIAGVLAALSGLVLTARLGAALPTAGQGIEMDAIGSVVIGGASLAGGEGTMFGTFIGVLIMAVLNNGLNLLNVNPFYQQILKGFVILLAVLIDILKRNKKA
jgi:ribose transport system permease protein